MSKPTYYCTTPIYYVTAKPHIGSAYTTIAGDVISRYKRLCGYDVHYLTGTDEHGLKVRRAAEEKGLTPRELADSVVVHYHEAWKMLNISHDDFIRTTDDRHETVVQKIYEKLHETGHLYKADYEGWYCVSCEQFVKEEEEGKVPNCPDCGKPCEKDAEECYFFPLSKFEDKLLKLYDQNPGFVKPPSRLNEVRNRVKSGLRDLSVTRSTLEWGVPLPFDPEHRAYVWVDALSNYITALGYGSGGELFDRFWPADCQLIGKDIIWFHAVIWPAILMAIGVEPPKMVFAHGWWTHNGEKMSKSKNNFVDPEAVVDLYGVDALRYFLLRELTFGMDGDYKDAAMDQRYHSELAGDLGNLVYRTLSMIGKYFDGVVPDPAHEPNGPLAEAAASLYEDVDATMNELQFNRTLDRIWAYVRRANQYVEECKPWQLAKSPESRPELAATMYHLAEAVRILAVVIAPFMPETSAKILEQLGMAAETREMKDALQWGLLPVGGTITRGDPLFPRIELENDK
jgi:methionyl-tRNA synthetase